MKRIVVFFALISSGVILLWYINYPKLSLLCTLGGNQCVKLLGNWQTNNHLNSENTLIVYPDSWRLSPADVISFDYFESGSRIYSAMENAVVNIEKYPWGSVGEIDVGNEEIVNGNYGGYLENKKYVQGKGVVISCGGEFCMNAIVELYAPMVKQNMGQ